MIDCNHITGSDPFLAPAESPKTRHAPAHELPCETAARNGQRVLVAGCGYVGLGVARQLHATGWTVIGITRTAESAQRLQGEPFRVLACDIGERTALAALGSFDAVISCVSSGRSGPDAYRTVYLEGTRNLIEVFHPSRFLFTSSTSVYGQTDGTVVTEESPAEPERETAKILREAEALALSAGGIVARLAGIYGHDRWALLQKFLAGTAVIEGDGGRFLNQIHRADAVLALVRLLNLDVAPGVYNVSDGAPVTQKDIYTAFAESFQRPLPPVGLPNLDRKRGWTHKQLSNAKLRALGWRPLYPSYREALAEIR